MINKSYNYNAYGLSIQSDVVLPELLPSPEEEPEVVIKLGKLGRPSVVKNHHNSFHYHFGSEEAYFRWEDTAAFLVRDGREINVDPAPGAEEAMIRVLLLGVVLAVLLHQRGLLVLHASAVVLNGGAVAFLGAKGCGKSTIAAAMYSRGHLHLADDLVAINANGNGTPMALSGYPQLKLWPVAAASSLEEDPEMLPRVILKSEKRARRTADRFSASEIPLRAIYSLCGGPEGEVKKLKPQEGMFHLIGNSYMARFGSELLRDGAATKHFRQCAKLAGEVPVRQLARPDRLELLPSIAELLEYHQGCDTTVGDGAQMTVATAHDS